MLCVSVTQMGLFGLFFIILIHLRRFFLDLWAPPGKLRSVGNNKERSPTRAHLGVLWLWYTVFLCLSLLLLLLLLLPITFSFCKCASIIFAHLYSFSFFFFFFPFYPQAKRISTKSSCCKPAHCLDRLPKIRQTWSWSPCMMWWKSSRLVFCFLATSELFFCSHLTKQKKFFVVHTESILRSDWI